MSREALNKLGEVALLDSKNGPMLDIRLIVSILGGARGLIQPVPRTVLSSHVVLVNSDMEALMFGNYSEARISDRVAIVPDAWSC